MLKKIPSEQPAGRPVKNTAAAAAESKRKKKSHSTPPKAKIQKKDSIVSNAECKIIRLVGNRLINYGKKTFTSNEEYRRLIRDVQISVLCLQKQQRQFIRKELDKKERDKRKK